MKKVIQQMGKSQKYGYDGEIGILNLLIGLYPEGHPQRDAIERSKSKGVNDVGDISAVPYTMIECKNSKASESTLLNNAEWKSQNAKRPMWWLTKKERGIGQANAHNWNAMCTVEGFFDGYKPKVQLDDSGAFLELSLDQIKEACEENTEMIAEITANYPHIHRSNYPWKLHLIFRSFVQNAQNLRRETIAWDGYLDPREEDRYIPIVIYPRAGYPVEKWYVFTYVAGMIRALETVGSLIEMTHEYQPEEIKEGA